MRWIGWVACLILIFGLVLGGLKPGLVAFKQALGIRELLQAGTGNLNDDPNNPFVCLREAGNSSLALTALPKISNGYLQGVGFCLAGEEEAGLAKLNEVKGHSNAVVQYAAGLSAKDSQAGADVISGALLSNEELAVVIKKLSVQSDVDIFPWLRILAKQANDQPGTWIAWLQGSSRLERTNEWQAALDWINEGLMMAPQEVQSSLFLRAGQIYQTRLEPLDYQAAVAAYNRAIENGGWIYPSDEANAHHHRGEVYRTLKDEYGPILALQEYQAALNLRPGDYLTLIDIGFVYLRDLIDLDLAESYFKQALNSNEKDPTAYLFIGDVWVERGDKVLAASWYGQSLEHQPNWQPALDRLKALEGK